MEKPRLQEVILAALFHDIGKFAQRAGEESLRRKELEAYRARKAFQGEHYTHQHVLYTQGFIEDIRDFLPSGVNYQSVANIAAEHHNPDSFYARIIAEADRLSAGMDRVAKVTGEEKVQFYETPLKSIFSTVTLNKEPGDSGPSVLAPAPLDGEAIFPVSSASVGKQDFSRLWSLFMEDIKALKGLEEDVYLPALDAVLQRYLWCIPSSTMDHPDISLYDHGSTTAAFAAALYQYCDERGIGDASWFDGAQRESPFILVSGDVSGIQRYIFDLKTHESNAKLLRARSFEIQYLTNSAAGMLLDDFGLPPNNILTNAGGRFLILLPFLRDARQRLTKIRKKVETFFLENYFGELSLNISAGVTASFGDMHRQNIGSLFVRTNGDVAEAKRRKFSTVLLNVEDHIRGRDYNEIRLSGSLCPLCEKRAGVKSHRGSAEEGGEICAVCDKLVGVGEKLPKARIILVASSMELKTVSGSILQMEESEDARRNGGLQTRMYKPGYGLSPVYCHIPRIPTGERGEGDVMTFDQIAQKARGIKRIAMLKADVDNLGALFSLGFGDRQSVSRLASLSRMLNYFFSTWLADALEKKFPNVYTVFSGGDDLCLIGPWDEIIRFSLFLRKEFGRLSGSNPFLTLSAGMAAASRGMPVRTLAEETQRLLDMSKEPGEDGNKDKVTMFDTTVGWRQFEELIDEGEWLFEQLQKNTLSPSFLYRLLHYHTMEQATKPQTGDKRKVNTRNLLWLSHFTYDVTRNIEKRDVRDRIKEIVHKNIDSLRIPVSYAAYLNRKDKGKEE